MYFSDNFRETLGISKLMCGHLNWMAPHVHASSPVRLSIPLRYCHSHIFSPHQCFLGPGGQFGPPIPYFEGVGPKTNMCCMALKPFNKCFRAATTKKNTIFRRKMARKCQFWAQIRVARSG